MDFCPKCLSEMTGEPFTGTNLIRINYILMFGTTLIGVADQCPTCRSYVSTRWLVILVPVFPTASFRVQEFHDQQSGQTSYAGRQVPLNRFHLAVGVALVLAVVSLYGLSLLGDWWAQRRAAQGPRPPTAASPGPNRAALRGERLLREGDFANALVAFDEAIRAAPSDAVLYFRRGVSHKQLGHFPQAVEDYEKAIALGFRENAYTNLGNAYRHLGQLEKALTAHKQAVARFPGMVETFLNRGNVYTDLNRLAEAKADFTMACDLEPKNPKAILSLADCLYRMKDYDGALSLATRGIGFLPDNPYGYSLRGNILTEKKDWQKARADFDKALALDPKEPEILYYRGRFNAKAGDRSGCVADMTASARLGYEKAQAFLKKSGVTW